MPVEPPPAARSAPQASLDARLDSARRELDRGFVVFAVPDMVIDTLDVPVAAPVTVGSTPGPRTLMSDDSGVVSVDANGTLLAHRDGTTRIRATGSTSSLKVVVRTRGQFGGSSRVAGSR